MANKGKVDRPAFVSLLFKLLKFKVSCENNR